MKKLFVLFIAVVMVLASCGAPADTVDAVVTDEPATEAPATEAPETEAPETEAPATEAPVTEAPVTEAPETEAPETEAPETEAPKTEDEGKAMLYSFDFATGAANPNGFEAAPSYMELGNGGFKVNKENGLLLIKDKQLKLVGNKTMVETDITFDVLPHKADGVTNFPLSILSWIRTTSSTILYDWIFKMDDQGAIYIKDLTTPSEKKIEAGKRYTFGVLFDDNAHTAKVYIDGELIGEKAYSTQTLTDSSVRVFDSGAGKAHFTATIHASRAYVVE